MSASSRRCPSVNPRGGPTRDRGAVARIADVAPDDFVGDGTFTDWRRHPADVLARAAAAIAREAIALGRSMLARDRMDGRDGVAATLDHLAALLAEGRGPFHVGLRAVDAPTWEPRRTRLMDTRAINVSRRRLAAGADGHEAFGLARLPGQPTACLVISSGPGCDVP